MDLALLGNRGLQMAIRRNLVCFPSQAPVFGRLPRRGETIQVGSLEFRVLRADRRRIDLLRVITPKDLEPPLAEPLP